MELSHSASQSLVDEIAALASGKAAPDRAQAVVTKVDADGTAWVRLSGGDADTPCSRTSAKVEPGDAVSVRIAGGRATIEANYSRPATDDETANAAKRDASSAAQTADMAHSMALEAITDAEQASAAAASAITSAGEAAQAASDAQTAASNAATAAATADGKAVAAANAAAAASQAAATADGKAVQAANAASAAQTAATTANAAATSAGYGLSEVEKVVGTLNWIAEHGEYVAATETAVVQGRIYYTRTGTSPNYSYQMVTDIPEGANPAQRGWYYLVVDESVQNYIASHLSQTNYGLDLLVDGSLFKLHLGTVDGTKNMGLYIINELGNIVSFFSSDLARIGNADGNCVEVYDDRVLIGIDWAANVLISANTMSIRNGLDRLFSVSAGDNGTDFYMGKSGTISYDRYFEIRTPYGVGGWVRVNTTEDMSEQVGYYDDRPANYVVRSATYEAGPNRFPWSFTNVNSGSDESLIYHITYAGGPIWHYVESPFAPGVYDVEVMTGWEYYGSEDGGPFGLLDENGDGVTGDCVYGAGYNNEGWKVDVDYKEGIVVDTYPYIFYENGVLAYTIPEADVVLDANGNLLEGWEFHYGTNMHPQQEVFHSGGLIHVDEDYFTITPDCGTLTVDGDIASSGEVSATDGNWNVHNLTEKASASDLAGKVSKSGDTMTGMLKMKDDCIWVQGGSDAGGNTNRLTTTGGMPADFQYGSGKRGAKLFSNGIAFADPYNGSSNNDAGWIRHIEETANSGTLEIGIGDNNAESVVVRQYNTSNAVTREAKLLDGSGNTSFPGAVSMQYVSSASLPSDLNTAHPFLTGYSTSTANRPTPYGVVMNISGNGPWRYQLAFPTYQTYGLFFRRSINATETTGWSQWYPVKGTNVLYSTTGSNGTIALTESADSYNHLRIYFFENDDNPYIYSSVDVFSPNGKSVNLHVTQKYNSGNMWSYTKTVVISGTSISNSIIGCGRINNSNGTLTNSDNHIFIIRVEGWNE